MRNIKQNLLEKLTSPVQSKTSKKRFLSLNQKNSKTSDFKIPPPPPKKIQNGKNHINCVERRIFQEIEYKLLEQMKLNKDLINRLKNLEKPLMASFDFIIDFYEDLLTLPENFLSDQKKNFSNFSFDNEIQSLNKNEYLKNMVLNFLEINRNILVEFCYENKLLGIIENYNKKEKKIKESEVIKNEYEKNEFENSKKFYNKMNIFKESLTSSILSNTLKENPEKILQKNLENNFLLKKNENNFEIFKAKYKWKGENEKDMSFNKGDIIKIYEKDKKGWFFGINLNNGEKGCLPCTYIEIINT